MFEWFGKQLWKINERRAHGASLAEGEAGFTLIELLVVVIIIGILAAIAIPVFLAQRDKAYEAAQESDMRNMAAAATACSANNDGDYTNCDTAASLPGFHESPNVNCVVNIHTTSEWKGTCTNSKLTGESAEFDTAVGHVVRNGYT